MSRLAPAALAAPAAITYALVLFAPLAAITALSVQGFDPSRGILPSLTFANWQDLATDPLFAEALGRTLRIAALTTLICALLGVPEAYIIRRMPARWRGLALLVAVGPLLVSVVVRTFGWLVLLGSNGLVNQALQALGLPGAPYRMLFTEGAIVAGLVHVMVPLVVLSTWASLARLDPALEPAAISLGASRLAVFRRVVLPNVLPGVLGGCLLVFCLSASAFATPAILGGRRLKVVSTLAYGEFLNTMNWPLGAAIAVALLLAILAVVLLWGVLVERPLARRLHS